MATGTYAPNPVFTAWDDDGDPISGALLYTYVAGTTTPLATYSNVGLTVANTNPVVCNSAGRATIFLSPTSYKWVLKNASGVTIWTRDNIGSVPSTNIDNDVSGTAGEALTATQAVYLSGTGWLKADADVSASSLSPIIGFVVADTVSGTSGTFRLSGRMTGFTGLTPGTDYYLSGTAGEITSTAPTNARYVGRADSISSLIITPNPPAVTDTRIAGVVDSRIKGLCQGRLSLTTGVAVTTTDVTAATTLYWVPYEGNEVGLYSGSAWVSFAQAQLSIAVPATTATMYDVFVDYNAGVPALSLTAWTNLTTPATALTEQDGVPVLTGATGKRHVGWMRTGAVSGQTEDSEANRWVRNRYNPVPRSLRKIESTDSWAYTLATYRQANNAATNKVSLIGDGKTPTRLKLMAHAANGGTVNVWGAIGYDSTTVPVGSPIQTCIAIAGVPTPLSTEIVHQTGAGSHDYNWLERSTASGTTTWYGDNGDATLIQSGLFGTMEG